VWVIAPILLRRAVMCCMVRQRPVSTVSPGWPGSSPATGLSSTAIYAERHKFAYADSRIMLTGR
jgi:hypothetical protein